MWRARVERVMRKHNLARRDTTRSIKYDDNNNNYEIQINSQQRNNFVVRWQIDFGANAGDS